MRNISGFTYNVVYVGFFISLIVLLYIQGNDAVKSSASADSSQVVKKMPLVAYGNKSAR